MLPPTMKIARINSTGKCYIVVGEGAGKVRCKGEVLRVSGASAMHETRDRVFLRDKVSIFQTDLTESLLIQLKEQNMPKFVVKPSKIRKPKQHPLANCVGGYWMLTAKAIKQLEAEGEDIAYDGLGNYLDENTLQDAAVDAASYHSDFTDAGMPEGFNKDREAVADMIYEGMLKGLARVKAEGRSTSIRRG